MGMRFVLLFAVCLIVEVSGCSKISSHDEAVVDHPIVARCAWLLGHGNEYVSLDSLENLREDLLSSARALNDHGAKIRFAEECRHMLMNAVLVVNNEDYRRYSAEVLRFESFSATVFTVMCESGMNESDLMDCFFDCQNRYLEACFSIPLDAKLPGEDRATARLRKLTARNLAARYQSDWIKYKKVVFPAHLKMFSDPLRSVYEQRCDELGKRGESLLKSFLRTARQVKDGV